MNQANEIANDVKSQLSALQGLSGLFGAPKGTASAQAGELFSLKGIGGLLGGFLNTTALFYGQNRTLCQQNTTLMY